MGTLWKQSQKKILNRSEGKVRVKLPYIPYTKRELRIWRDKWCI
jgi:hypothetical protein